ncbi:MAG: hypothetical protein N2596_06290 [Syntrophorhabdaceae bacterium]|nr:hypothetical protein [Syntrophorhabdaceae bacterium]
MLKQKFLSNNDSLKDETLKELLNITIERLPQYKWLIKNKEGCTKKETGTYENKKEGLL